MLDAASNGFARYDWKQIGPGNFGVSSTLQTGPIASIGGSIVATLAAIDTGFHQSADALMGSATSTQPDRWTGGMWSRGGGDATVKANATGLSGTSALPANLQTHVNFGGYQVGFDTGRLNWGGTGWNAHVGVSASEVIASSNEQTGTTTAMNVNIPFITAYGVVTNGAFFSDLSYRHDFVDSSVTSSLQQVNINSESLKGDGNAVKVSAGYHMQWDRYFIEPSGSLGLAFYQFNDLPVSLGASGTPVNSTIKFNEITSELGRAGVRIGASVQADTWMLTPYTILNVWHEFAGQAQDQFIANTASFATPFSVSRIGTFGQVGIGTGAQVLNSGFFGFIQGDARFGQNITGLSISAGARYSF